MIKWRDKLLKFNAQTISLCLALVLSTSLAVGLMGWLIQPMPNDLPSSEGSQPPALSTTSQSGQKPTLVAVPTRVVAPNVTPNWAHINRPLERAKDYRDEIDPKRKVATGYKNMIVLSAATFKVRHGKRFIKIELQNVDGIPFRAKCQLTNKSRWPCGGTARASLSRILNRRTLFCNLEIKGKISVRKTYPAQCWLGYTDLADIIIREGWGTVRDSQDTQQLDLQNEAKRLGKGQWRKR